MTNEELQAIERRNEARTQVHWHEEGASTPGSMRNLILTAPSDVSALLAEVKRLKRQARDGIETAIFTALVAETTGADDSEWIEDYVRPRVDQWTTEICSDKGLL